MIEKIGKRGIALCRYRDGSIRLLPYVMAERSLEHKGKVVEIIETAPTWRELSEKSLRLLGEEFSEFYG